MVYRLSSIVGSLMAIGLMQAVLVVPSAAQQEGSRANIYNGAPSYGPAPYVMMKPSRNLSDVFNGALSNSDVRPASHQEPTLAPRGGQIGPSGQSAKTGEAIPPGIVAENGAVFGPEGEYFDDSMAGEYCDECDGYCPPGYSGNYYVRGEYLLWWLSGDKYSPLVTTSPSNTPQAQAGVLGESGTRTLFGDDSLNGGSRNGVRTVLGMYLTECDRLEADWFTLGSNGAAYHNSSQGDPILARPFFNLSTGAQDANLVAYPGVFSGRIDIRANTQFMGAGIHLARNLSYCGGCGGYSKLDFIYGFRYLGLYENFDADTTTTVTGQSTAPIGTVFNVHDAFATSNNFFGGNVGILGEANRGRWFFTGAARLGIGGTREHVSVGGSTTVAQPGEDVNTFTGGLLAMPTNIGRYSNNGFSLVPHLELRVAYLIAPRIRWTVGYDLMYWSRVVRPGDQSDLFVNPTQASGQQLRGTPGPLFPFKETDLWISGVSTGFEFNF
ncbi:MAG: BBP7 family outer membrane beta-barrel protein [Pirellulales bacterium]|nr:BBP7 family outer membrane beta-barrel protein [Pirellulales bacterium]